MSIIIKKFLASVPVLSWISVILLGVLSWTVRESNAIGADSDAFNTLVTLRTIGVFVLLIVGLSMTVFVLRPRLLPAAGTSFYVLAMFIALAQAALLRGEPLAWLAYGVGGACGIAATLHLSRSLGAAEQDRSRLQKKYEASAED